MIRTARHKAFWLNTIKLLVIVFALNASTGFSACCVDIQNDGPNQLVKTDMAANNMPCHGGQTEQSNDLDITNNLDKSACCASCIITALPLTQLTSNLNPSPSNITSAFQYFISSNIAPPFRPPIFHLS